jgi:hypothetical protein
MVNISKVNTKEQTTDFTTAIETYVSMSMSTFTEVSGSTPSRYILSVIEEKWGDGGVVSASNAASGSI